MIKVAFINNETHLIEYIASPAVDSLYTDGAVYGVCTARFIPINSNDIEYLETQHWEIDSFKPHNRKQFDYQIWDNVNFIWKLPDNYVEIIQNKAIEETNQLASQKILSKYPIYKQLNLARTDDAQVMYSWIDNIRNLSNIATANIEQAVTQEEITTIVDNFKTELGNIA